LIDLLFGALLPVEGFKEQNKKPPVGWTEGFLVLYFILKNET
jgi:hypothetical protein